jgi:hypothetical protein
MSRMHEIVFGGMLGLLLLWPGLSAGTVITVGASEDQTTITAAIAAASDGDTIKVMDAVLTEVGILVNKNITIMGQGMYNTTVQAHADSGAATDRVFKIDSAKTVIIEKMTIQHGVITADVSGGAGIYNNYGNLTLEQVVITSNLCKNTFNGKSVWGGGIFSLGALRMKNCVVVNNYVYATNAYGGGIFSLAPHNCFYIENSTICNNCSYGFHYTRGFMDYVNGYSYGGGIYTSNTSASGDTLINCTISDNISAGTSGTWAGTIVFGAGIFKNQGSMMILNTTICNNSAASNWQAQGGGYSAPGDGYTAPTIKNTIIANNIAASSRNNINTIVYSNGYNLVASDQDKVDTLAANGNTNAGNIFGQDPKLSALASNGGYSPTCALLAGSPCIDAGTSTGAPLLDQRQNQRNGATDIGAYEYGGAAPVTLSSFTTEVVAAGVKLAWTTETELNNLGFNVLRSSSATGSFVNINGSLIPGAGSTVQPQAYAFTDNVPLSGTSYYQLEQVDVNGNKSYSAVVSAIMATTSISHALPAMNIPQLSIQPRVLYNMNGVRMLSSAHLCPGIYFTQQNGVWNKVLVTE